MLKSAGITTLHYHRAMKKLTLLILAALLSGCATGDSSNTSFSADDQMFAAMMIPHHEQAIEMADMVIDSANEEAALLGKAIVESQSAEIVRMRKLLTR
ncbi:MAG: DUF305 domain-containing protein [Actinobacteria bacterium]|nr:DUF305 domain-containing protein [Actinomycetota bacterium]